MQYLLNAGIDKDANLVDVIQLPDLARGNVFKNIPGTLRVKDKPAERHTQVSKMFRLLDLCHAADFDSHYSDLSVTHIAAIAIVLILF